MARPPLHRELGLRRFLGAWSRAQLLRVGPAVDALVMRALRLPPCKRCGRRWRPRPAETDRSFAFEVRSAIFLSADPPELRPRVLRCRYCSADSLGVVLPAAVDPSWPPPAPSC